jgi:hypothetical protein
MDLLAGSVPLDAENARRFDPRGRRGTQVAQCVPKEAAISHRVAIDLWFNHGIAIECTYYPLAEGLHGSGFYRHGDELWDKYANSPWKKHKGLDIHKHHRNLLTWHHDSLWVAVTPPTIP